MTLSLQRRGRGYRISLRQQQAILNMERAGIGPTDQARQLGLPVTRIMATRRRLAEAGMIARRPSHRGPDWTIAEIDQALELVDEGYSLDEIASRVRCKRDAVKVKLTRLKVSHLRRDYLLNARRIAHILGLGCAKTVTRWIALGWLPGQAARPGEGCTWRITWDALKDFLAIPDYWMAWQPERITDLALREWAMELRKDQPRWLSVGQVANRYCVGVHSVNDWIRKGLLTGYRYGNWWIREDTLQTFVMPSSREGFERMKAARQGSSQ